LSVTLTEAVRLPAAEGVNVALAVHIVPGVRELPHVLVRVKSPGLAPATTMLAMVNVALPVLVRVTVWAMLGVPTVWSPKETSVLLMEIPANETEMEELPPQDVEDSAKAIQAA